MDIESFAIGLMVSAKNGGGTQPTNSPWKKITEQDFEVNTSSTSAEDVGTIDCGSEVVTNAKLIFVRVRDKAGKRNDYYFGNDAFIIQTSASKVGYCYHVNGSGSIVVSTSTQGIYPDTIDHQGKVKMVARYHSSATTTIDGTYHVEVYTLEWPDNVSPFA